MDRRQPASLDELRHLAARKMLANHMAGVKEELGRCEYCGVPVNHDNGMKISWSDHDRLRFCDLDQELSESWTVCSECFDLIRSRKAKEVSVNVGFTDADIPF